MSVLMVSISATLLRFKNFKAVSKSSVVKLESFVASLKVIKHFVKLVETGRIFLTRKGPTFAKKNLNSFPICSAECNDFLLIFSALRKILFFCYILRFISFIICHDLLILDISMTFYVKISFCCFFKYTNADLKISLFL